MPEVAVGEMEMLRLWSRCKAFGKLPFAGGILEQPAWVMDALDTVNSSVESVRAKRDEDAKTDLEKQKLMGNLSA